LTIDGPQKTTALALAGMRQETYLQWETLILLRLGGFIRDWIYNNLFLTIDDLQKTTALALAGMRQETYLQWETFTLLGLGGFIRARIHNNLFFKDWLIDDQLSKKEGKPVGFRLRTKDIFAVRKVSSRRVKGIYQKFNLPQSIFWPSTTHKRLLRLRLPVWDKKLTFNEKNTPFWGWADLLGRDLTTVYFLTTDWLTINNLQKMGNLSVLDLEQKIFLQWEKFPLGGLGGLIRDLIYYNLFFDDRRPTKDYCACRYETRNLLAMRNFDPFGVGGICLGWILQQSIF
jgi:hypothetical protein